MKSRINKTLCIAILLLTECSVVYAAIESLQTPRLRLRLGGATNTPGDISTLVYNPGFPSALSGLTGVTVQNEVSTLTIGGGSLPYGVRIVADVNRRGGGEPNPVEGTFSYDSSSGMTCQTPATCGGFVIPFDRIRWNAQDGDTLIDVLQYDNSVNQVFHMRSDTNPSNTMDFPRHKNHYEFIYINDVFRPAGTYLGTVTATGVGP